MKENFEWFLEHYDEIFQLCGECHVVIYEKQLVGIFGSNIQAYSWVKEQGLLGKCNIQYCNGDESGYTAYIN